MTSAPKKSSAIRVAAVSAAVGVLAFGFWSFCNRSGDPSATRGTSRTTIDRQASPSPMHLDSKSREVPVASVPWQRKSAAGDSPTTGVKQNAPRQVMHAENETSGGVSSAALPWKRDPSGAVIDSEKVLRASSSSKSPNVPGASLPWKSDGAGEIGAVSSEDHSESKVTTAAMPWTRGGGQYAPAWVPLAQTHSLREPPALEDQRRAAETEGKYKDAKIKLIGDFEGAYLPAVEKISETHFAIDFKNEQTQMFLFKLKGVQGKVVRIDLKNVAVDAIGSSKGGRWNTLNPVFSYVPSLAVLSSFESVPVKTSAPATQAYNGPLIPDTRGQKWNFMQEVWVDNHSLCLVQRFEEDEAFVGMKYPYTVAYHEAYLREIAKSPYAHIVKVGQSVLGRPLEVVEIGEGTDEERSRKPCIVLCAREHANEHDTSWAVQGAIAFLIGTDSKAEAIRRSYDFICIPLLDPDAAATELHEGIIETFSSGQASKESLAYAQFFKKRVDQGGRIDYLLNLHNVESGEMPYLSFPEVSPEVLDYTSQADLLNLICDRFASTGLSFRNIPGARGTRPSRLGGYLRATYGCLHLPLEVNSQEPTLHLTLQELKASGAVLAVASAEHLGSSSGQKWRTYVDGIIRDRRANWDKFSDSQPSNSALRAEESVRGRAKSDQLLNAVLNPH